MARTLEYLADHCYGNERPDCPILAVLAEPTAAAEQRSQASHKTPRFGVDTPASSRRRAALDLDASDPAVLGWMGSPPSKDRTVRFEDGSYFRFAALRWSISNFRQLMPTINVSRGLGARLGGQSLAKTERLHGAGNLFRVSSNNEMALAGLASG